MQFSLSVRPGRAIRDLRSAAGFSREDSARHIGVHRAYATVLEAGKRTEPQRLERVARSAGCR